MPALFGQDIAGKIASAFKGKLLSGTLSKKAAGTRTPGQLTGGTNPTAATHTFEGFIEDKTEVWRGGTLVARGGKFVTMLGASITPAAEPETGDEVTIEGQTWRIVEITGRDPAAATFQVRVEK